MTILSEQQVAAYAIQAGFRGDALITAVAVSFAEDTDHNTTAVNVNNDGSRDRGLWQINDKAHPDVSDAAAFDPAQNAAAAYRISSSGFNWQPWTTFTTSNPQISYKRYLLAAAAAVGSAPTNGITGNPAQGAGQIVGTSPDVEPPSPPDIDMSFVPSRTLDDISLEGVSDPGKFRESVVEASVDLSTTQASEVTVTFVDPFTQLISANYIDIGLRVAFRGLDLQVKTFQFSDHQGVGGFTLTASTRGVEVLKQYVLQDPPSNMSPTMLLQQQCALSGLTFYGKGSGIIQGALDVKQVNRPDNTQGNETIWEYCTRKATEFGYWLFEAAGTVWFGPPSWIVRRTTRVRVGFRGVYGDDKLDAHGIPTCERTLNTDATVTTRLQFQVPRFRGEQMRPGMGIDLKGVDPAHQVIRPDLGPTPPGAFSDGGAGAIAQAVSGVIQRSFPKTLGFDKLYIVTRVSYPGDPTQPVSIEAQEPVDPAPQVPSTPTLAGQVSGALNGILNNLGVPAGTFPGANAPGAHNITDYGLFEYCAVVARYVRDTFHVTDIGGYRVDSYHEHDTRRCADFMVYGDSTAGYQIKDFLLSLPQTKYCIWQQHIWYPGGGGHDMEDRGSPTQNHRDHVHWLSN